MAYTPFVVTHLSMPSWIYVQLFCFNICMAWFWFKWLLSPYLILWPGIWNYLWLEVCSYVPDIVLVGGPSGSGKTSLAHKMANIVGCEVVSLERYYKSEQVKDFKYDDFSSLDLSLLSKVRIWYSKLFLLLYFYILLDSKFKRYEKASQFNLLAYAMQFNLRKIHKIWCPMCPSIQTFWVYMFELPHMILRTF